MLSGTSPLPEGGTGGQRQPRGERRGMGAGWAAAAPSMVKPRPFSSSSSRARCTQEVAQAGAFLPQLPRTRL